MNQITENQARDMYNSLPNSIDIDLAIKKWKELGYIKKTRLEEAREIYEFYKNNKCYKINDDKLKSLRDGYISYTDPHVIMVHDLNRIVSHYELVIKELQEKLEDEID